MNRKQNNQIKINEYLLSGQSQNLKELYKQIMLEAVAKDQSQAEILPQEKGISNNYALSSTASPEVQRRIRIDQLPPGIEDMGNGWWKINGRWYFITPGFYPVGVNEHGVPVLNDKNWVEGATPANLGGPGRFDKFPKNPSDGDVTRILGKDGKYYYYVFSQPPGVWHVLQDNNNPNFGWDDPSNMPLPPNPPIPRPVIPQVAPFGQGINNGNSPMWEEEWQNHPGLPRPGTNPQLPPWPSPEDNPWDPVLPPPDYGPSWPGVPYEGPYAPPYPPYPYYPGLGYDPNPQTPTGPLYYNPYNPTAPLRPRPYPRPYRP